MKTLVLNLSVALLILSSAAQAVDEKPDAKANNPADHGAFVPGPKEGMPKAEALAKKEASKLQAIGVKVFGIKWQKKVVAVADRGFQVMTDSVTTLSYRPAGNAYFVQTGKAGLSGKSAFRGNDKQLIEHGRALLSKLGINKSEIAETRVLQQYVTEGQRDPATGKMEVDSPRKDRRSLLVTRAVKGIPVVNSRLLLDLDGNGKIAALELSWPSIHPKVMAEAQRFHKLTGSEFKPHELKGAKVESVTAVILHSPAASFVDDQVAAIRVIYAATDAKVGKKPVAYLDAAGHPVSLPRQSIATVEKPLSERPVEHKAPPPR